MPYFSVPEDIRVGVVGYGGAFNMGRQHLREMSRAGMTPFAVCEVDLDRLAVAEQDFPGIETYNSLEAMLKKSEVNLLVHITPHDLHYPLAAKCIKAGKHVITEKPFVLTTAQADRLIAMAEKHDVTVSTYHNRHWDGWIVRAVKEVVQKQTLGDVFRVEAHMGGYDKPGHWWRTSKSVSGGVLYDWGVHLIEYALQIIPDEIVEVSGYAQNGYWDSVLPKSFPWKNDMNEDEAHAIVRFAGGQMLHLSISSLRSDPNPPKDFLKIVGTKGSYSIDWNQWTTRRANRKHELVEKTGPHPQVRRRRPVLQERRRPPHRQGRPDHHPTVGPPTDPHP